MVDDSEIDFTYLPFAAAGLAFRMLSISALALSNSRSGPNDTLPTGAWMIAVLSTRYSTLPALISFTALPTSNVTVPVFGLGISPRGPSTLPSLPTDFIMSGVATTASKSSQFSPWIFATMSSPPTKSAPASCASLSFSPDATTSTRLLLPPSPCGRITTPRTIWSACFGSTPSRIASSTVSSNLANAALVTVATASFSGYCGFAAATSLAFVYFFPTAIPSPRSRAGCGSGPPPTRTGQPRPGRGRVRLPDLDSHAARRAQHGLDRGLQVDAVQVGHLDLGDQLDLLHRDLADLVLVRLAAALGDAGLALQQHGHRRRLGDERVGAVGVHGDHDGDDQALVLGRLGVEGLAEVHDVHAGLAERGAHGRRGRRLARGDLKLDLSGYLLHRVRAFPPARNPV